MKILVIRWGTLESFPPAINLSESLRRLGHDITVMANGVSDSSCLGEGFEKVDLGKYPEPGGNGWLSSRLSARSKLRSYVRTHVDDFDLVWTTSDNSAIYCNDLIPPDKHILQLAELVEYVPVIGSASLFKSKRFVEHARRVRRVVVPETNRAFIQKAWWNLPVTPAVLPNKPAMDELPELSPEDEPAYVETLKRLKSEGEKVILYQGAFTKDRDIDTYCEAVELLGDGYEMCLMGPENECSKELCEKYEHTHYIGVYPPPMHLYAGQYALAGVLPYKSNPERVAHLSPLNSLYCAPNKLWEYALVGLPMVANNLPGLELTINKFGIGATAQEGNPASVAKAISSIAVDDGTFSANCSSFYKCFDFDAEVSDILSGCDATHV